MESVLLRWESGIRVDSENLLFSPVTVQADSVLCYLTVKYATKIAFVKMSVHIWRKWCSSQLHSAEIFDRFRQWEWPSLCVIHKEWSIFSQIMKENDTLYSSLSFSSKSKKWLSSVLVPYEANTLGWGNDMQALHIWGQFCPMYAGSASHRGLPWWPLLTRPIPHEAQSNISANSCRSSH